MAYGLVVVNHVLIDNTVSDLYREIGKRVADRRHAAGLTQESVAERAGIGTSYLAHIEAGRKKPTLDTLEGIARALSVETWQLLTDSKLSADEKLWQARERKLAEKVRRLSPNDIELLVAMATKMEKKRK